MAQVVSRSWLALSLTALVASAGCKVSLRGIPIKHESAHDAGTDAASDDTDDDEDEIDGDEEADASVDRDASPPDEGELPVYRYTFDEVEEDTLPVEWLDPQDRTAVSGERLCLPPGAEVRLNVVQGRYGYVHVAVPAEVGLVMTAEGKGGELFHVTWQGLSTMDAPQPHVSLGGLALARQSPYTVQRYEATLDYATRKVTAQARGETARSVSFASAASELVALSFRNTAAESMVCVDDVYLAAGAPAVDPFEDSTLNACAPQLANQGARCIANNCCEESHAVFGEICWQACPSGTCSCAEPSPDLCAARCIADHPSHSMADCTDLCRLTISSKNAGPAMEACVQSWCHGAADFPDDPLDSARPEPPAAAADEGQRLVIQVLDQGSFPRHARLAELDLRSQAGHVLADFSYLEGDRITLYSEPSHASALVLVSSRYENQDEEEAESDGRLYRWSAARGLTEIRLPEPVMEVVPSAARDFVWVKTRSRRTNFYGLYLVCGLDVVWSKHDVGATALGFGPGDRYAFALHGVNVILLDLVALEEGSFYIDGLANWWQPRLTFESSILWLGLSGALQTEWNWTDLRGDPVDGALPVPPRTQEQASQFLAGSGALYWNDRTAPLRVATLPADFSTSRFTPAFARGGSVLYGVRPDELHADAPHGLVMADASGAFLAVRAPVLPVAEEGGHVAGYVEDVVTLDGEHGMFTVAQSQWSADQPSVDTRVFHTFAFDGSAFTTERVAERPFQAGEAHLIHTRPDSSLFVVEAGSGETVVRDVLSGDGLTLPDPWRAGRLIWPVYPAAPAYRAEPSVAMRATSP